MMYVTTSWDDGHKLDIKLKDILDHHGIKGTFYISKQYSAIGELLLPADIKVLSERHEVGAHTLTHPNLTLLSESQMSEEIMGSKQWLESIIGEEVKMFCYPSGFLNEKVVDAVKKSGFAGARTTDWPLVYFPVEPHQMATTLQVYPLPFRKLTGGRYWWRKLLQPLFERYSRLRALGVPLWRMYSWQEAAERAFDYAYAHGNTFHLWGHSWELENYGMWEELDALLGYIASKPNIHFVTNSELLAIAKKEHSSAP